MQNKEAKVDIIGMRGQAEIIQVFATVANTDSTEGRGINTDRSYHIDKETARAAAIGIGIMGGNGEVRPRLAVQFKNGVTFVLAEEGMVPAEGTPHMMIKHPSEEQLRKMRETDIKIRAMAKLTPEERKVLGFS